MLEPVVEFLDFERKEDCEVFRGAPVWLRIFYWVFGTRCGICREGSRGSFEEIIIYEEPTAVHVAAGFTSSRAGILQLDSKLIIS